MFKHCVRQSGQKMETPTNTKSCKVDKLQDRKTDELPLTATTSDKREGKNSASLHDISYCLHLGLVVLLRLFIIHKEDEQFDFELIFEDPIADKFNEISVHYSSPKHSSKDTVYIRTKHRKTMQTYHQKSKYDIVSKADLLSRKKNSAFSAGMYFEAFLDTHKPESPATQTYIVCTNKMLDPQLAMINCMYRNTSDVYVLKFLQDINAKCYQLDCANNLEGLDEILKKAVNDSCTDKHEFIQWHMTDIIKSFYDNFILVCEAADEAELKAVAIGLLKEQLNFQNITTYEKLHYVMFDAINKGRKSFEPVDMKKLFKLTEDSFKLEYLRIHTCKNVDLSRAKHFEIKFCPTALRKTNLFKFIASEAPGTLCYRSSYGTEAAILIIEQTVELANYELLLINLSSYVASKGTKELYNDIATMFKHEMNKAAMLITIISQEKELECQELAKLIQEYGMKLVIVKRVKKEAASSRDTDIVDACVDSFRVKDLTEDTRTRLFQKWINLYGTSVALEKILEQSDSLSYLFDLILINEKESKSSHETKYNEIEQWYVDRRFVSYKRGKADYFDDNYNLPGLKDENTPCLVHIILNDAGFGKSTCFTKLSWRLASMIHSSFVIRLDAVELSTDFKQLIKADVHKLDALAILKILYYFIHLALFVHDGTKKNDSDIEKKRIEAHQCFEFLMFSKARVGVDDGTAKGLNLNTSQLSCLRLFKEKLNEKQMILLLDGFDEIAPDYMELVLKCLAKFAQLDGMRLVYISSRPYNFLEAFENTIPDSRIYQLEPFSANDQQRALCKYIRFNMDDLKSDDENLILDALLRDFRNLPIQLKSVPLFLRLAFEERFPLFRKCISSHGEIKFTKQKSLDIFQLIETFVNKKLERSFIENTGISLLMRDSVAVKEYMVKSMARTKNEHALLALFAMFNKKTRDILLNVEEQREAIKYMAKMGDASKKTGIIVRIEENNPLFILRILAEYFAALWLHKNIERMKTKDFFRSKSYWTNDFSTIREFLGRMILKESYRCEIHLAVLNQSIEQVKNILSENTFLAIVKDAFGRLPLHLAVSIQSEELVHQLLAHMSLQSINAQDDLLQWSALDYAFVTGSFENVKLLLARKAEVNHDALFKQICSNSLKELLANGNNYGAWLQSMESTKENADLFLFRLMGYFFNTKKLDINKKYTELNELTVLEFCIAEQMEAILNQLLTEPRTTNAMNSFKFALNYSFNTKLLKSSITIFKQLCLHQNISLVEDAQINENMILQQEHNIPALDEAQHPTVCCVHSSKNVRLPLPEYDEQDGLHDGYVIEALIAKAVHHGNTKALNYIVRKTNIPITNRLIVSVMRLLPKTKDVCHAKSMDAFLYLLDRTTDLYNVDEKGRNLLHMTAQNGCFFMMHCLIVKGFDPTLTNARNDWNIFHYLAFNDDDGDRSSKSLEYLMYEDKVNWFDSMDAMLFLDRIGGDGTVSTPTNIRKQNSEKLNKSQHALLGLLAVFKDECRNKLFTEEERAESIKLLQQLEQAEKTSEIIERKVCNSEPVFKHQIFAEYFAACWLYENKDRMRREPFFRSWSFWKSDFRRMRDIFDRLVLRHTEGCEVHLALVNLSVEQVSKFLSENPSLALAKDVLGRLPLHLSVWNKSLIPMKQLLETMTLESINVRDELFQWNALDYAFVSGCFKTSETLLAHGAEVNIDNLLQQICSNNLEVILIDTYNYGTQLRSNEYTKAIEDRLSIRVVDYLLNERRLDIYSQHSELDGLTVLGYCIKHNYDRLFKQIYLKVCNSTHHSLKLSEQLLETAVEHKSHTIIRYLMEERNIPLPQIKDSTQLISALNALAEKNQIKSFQNIFQQLCILCRISLVEDEQINDNMFLQQERNIPALDEVHHPTVCCIKSSKNVRLALPEYDEQDVMQGGYVIEALLAKAVHYGNIQILHYIVQKTNIFITNRLIVSVMRLLPKNKDVCHAKSMDAFLYLLDRTTDLYNVDEEGRNLLHMTAQNGCFFMMHCLIVKGFDPTLTNARNDWNIFHYLAFNDDGAERSSKSLEYLMYGDKLIWFNLMDSMLFTDSIGGDETVSMPTKIRKKNSDKLNKKQHALLGLLAVFKEECRNNLFTEQERTESIKLLQQLEQAEKTSEIIERKVCNSEPVFKHQIFAEYFAACWLYENKDRMRREPFFRSWSFWKSDFRRMRDIFDRLVLRHSEGCEVHLALVNLSVEQVSKFLSENPSLALAKDALGRLPLHLAVSVGNVELVHQLLQNMCFESINIRDELFYWSALDYAVVTDNNTLIKKILEKQILSNLLDSFHDLTSNEGKDLNLDAIESQYKDFHSERERFLYSNNQDVSLSVLNDIKHIFVKESNMINFICFTMTKNITKLFEVLFQNFCLQRNIPIVDDEDIEDVYIIDEIFVSEQTMSMLENQHDDINKLLEAAILIGNSKMVKYIVQKVNIVITNQMIEKFMRSLSNDDRVNSHMYLSTFDYLLNRTTDLFSHDEEGRNLLHIAAQNGWIYLLHNLLARGFKLNQINSSNGWNLFHYAVSNKINFDRQSLKTLEYLLMLGRMKYFDATDGANISVFDLAISNKCFHIAKILVMLRLEGSSITVKTATLLECIIGVKKYGEAENEEVLKYVEFLQFLCSKETTDQVLSHVFNYVLRRVPLI